MTTHWHSSLSQTPQSAPPGPATYFNSNSANFVRKVTPLGAKYLVTASFNTVRLYSIDQPDFLFHSQLPNYPSREQAIIHDITGLSDQYIAFVSVIPQSTFVATRPWLSIYSTRLQRNVIESELSRECKTIACLPSNELLLGYVDGHVALAVPQLWNHSTSPTPANQINPNSARPAFSNRVYSVYGTSSSRAKPHSRGQMYGLSSRTRERGLRVIKEINAHPGSAIERISVASNYFCATAANGTANIWDLPTMNFLGTISIAPRAIAVTACRNNLIAVSPKEDGLVFVYSIVASNGRRRAQFETHFGLHHRTIMYLHIMRNGQDVLSTSISGHISINRLSDGACRWAKNTGALRPCCMTVVGNAEQKVVVGGNLSGDWRKSQNVAVYPLPSENGTASQPTYPLQSVIECAYVRARDCPDELTEKYLVRYIRGDNINSASDFLMAHNLVLLAIRKGVVNLANRANFNNDIWFFKLNLYGNCTKLKDNPLLIYAVLKHAEKLNLVQDAYLYKENLKTQKKISSLQKEMQESFLAMSNRMTMFEDGLLHVNTNMSRIQEDQQALQRNVKILHGSLGSLCKAFKKQSRAAIVASIAKLVFCLIPLLSEAVGAASALVCLGLSGQDIVEAAAALGQEVIDVTSAAPAGMGVHVDLSNVKVFKNMTETFKRHRAGVWNAAIRESGFENDNEIMQKIDEFSAQEGWDAEVQWKENGAVNGLKRQRTVAALENQGRASYQLLRQSCGNRDPPVEKAILELQTVLQRFGIGHVAEDHVREVVFSFLEHERVVKEHAFVAMLSKILKDKEPEREFAKLHKACMKEFETQASQDGMIDVRMAELIVKNQMCKKGTCQKGSSNGVCAICHSVSGVISQRERCSGVMRRNASRGYSFVMVNKEWFEETVRSFKMYFSGNIR